MAVVSLHAGLAVPVGAQAPYEAADRSLQAVRELIVAGEHEAAIEAAKAARAEVEAAPRDPARLEQTYLLLVLSYVNYGNYQVNEHRAMAAETLYKEARTQIRECLSVPELRRIRLDRTSGVYPPEMITMFDEVRAEMFGGLRILALEPPDARVLLDSVPLTTLPGESLLGDPAVPVGAHTILVEREGYETRREAITITPATWQERPYTLDKKRGKKFYAAVGTGVLAVVGGAIALAVAGGGETAATAEPLPEPPPPPSR
jgi:hypothetical protein